MFIAVVPVSCFVMCPAVSAYINTHSQGVKEVTESQSQPVFDQNVLTNYYCCDKIFSSTNLLLYYFSKNPLVSRKSHNQFRERLINFSTNETIII